MTLSAINWINEHSPFPLNGTVLAVGATTLVAGPLVFWMVRSASGGSSKKLLKWGRCALDQEEYVKCKLTSVTKVSHNSAIYRFKLPKKEPLNLPIGKHLSVRATVGTRQAVRSYTPISHPNSVGFFDLLVKTYPMGCISKHLSELKVGDWLEVKGPKGTFEYAPNMARHLGMIAGGTGITPMYQVIRHVLEDPKDLTKIYLLYANVNENDILLREELEALMAAHPDRLQIHYTLGNPPSGWSHSQGFVTAAMIQERFPAPGKDVRILICGPPPMAMSMSEHCEALGYGPAKNDPTSPVYKF